MTSTAILAAGAAEAREIFRAFLASEAPRCAIAELGRALGIRDDALEDPWLRVTPELTERIASALETDGAAEALLREECGEQFDHILDLLEVGDLHPPTWFRITFAWQSQSELDRSAPFIALYKLGLLSLADPQAAGEVLLICPWLRHLLRRPLEEHAARKRAGKRPAPSTPEGIEQVFALVCNWIRAVSPSVTAKGAIYKRDKRKADDIFGHLDERIGTDCVATASNHLWTLGCVEVDSGRQLRIAGTAGRLFEGDPATFQRRLLLTLNPSLFVLAVDLLEILAEAAGNGSDGASGNESWVEESHLLARGELILAGHYFRGELERIEAVVGALVVMRLAGLIDSTEDEEDRRWATITPAGLAVLEATRSQGSGDGSASDDDGASGGVPDRPPAGLGAVVQPNLDVLVPLEAPSWIHWRVGAFARLQAIDSVCTYTLEKEHALRVFGREAPQGQKVDEWIGRLAACSEHALPENVTSALRSWLGSQGVVRVREGAVVVLEGDPSDSARAAFEELRRKLRGTAVVPGVFVLEGQALDPKARRALERSGLRIVFGGAPESETAAGRGPRRTDQTRQSAREHGGLWSFPQLCKMVRQHREILEQIGNEIASFCREAVVLSAIEEDDGDDGDDGDRDTGGIVYGPWAECELDPLGSIKRNPRVSSLLHLAVREGHDVDIAVLAKDGDTGALHEVVRSLRPLGIITRGTRPYIVGMSLESDEQRTFPIDTIRRARIRFDTEAARDPGPPENPRSDLVDQDLL